MTNKIRKCICYSFIILFILYFGVVGVYMISLNAFVFRLWEILIVVSGILAFFFLVSVLEDVEHNAYWIFSITFGAASMITTTLCHYDNIINGTGEPAFLTNDSLAWGLFFGLSYLFAAFTIRKDDNKRKAMRILFLIIAIMCFLGLLGPTMHIDALWFIAVAGYGPGALVLCVMQLKYLRLKNQTRRNVIL